MKESRKLRILLHAMTFKRDFGVCYILAKLLEYLGCECHVVNNTTVSLKAVQLWNPHAVFYVTLNWTKRLKALFPGSKLFLWSGEGGENYQYCDEPKILKDQNLFSSIRKSFLWGEKSFEYMVDTIRELGDKSPIDEDGLMNRFPLVGNPRLDLVKYKDASKKSHGKVKIGFIGSFPYINNTRHNTLALILFNRIIEETNVVEEVIFQVRLFEYYLRIVDELGTENYCYSLRPYPLEKNTEYLKKEPFKNGSVEVDDSIDFTVWLGGQDIIIGPISSTLTQIAVAEKTYICMDELAGRHQEVYESGLIPKELLKGIDRYMPQDFQNVLSMVRDYKNYKFACSINAQELDRLYSTSSDQSVIFKVALDIINTLKADQDNLHLESKIPSIVLQTSERVICYRKKIRELITRSHQKDYSYFDHRILPKAEDEYSEIVNNILAATENKSLIESLAE